VSILIIYKNADFFDKSKEGGVKYLLTMVDKTRGAGYRVQGAGRRG